MDLKKFSSEQLVSGLKNLVGKEREILSQILSYLREVEVRRLFVPMGYSSLFDFCTRELGYSSDAAYRRICAMRLGREVPEAKKKIESGTLALSSAAELYRFVSAQKKLGRSSAASRPENRTETGTQTQTLSGNAVPAVIELLNYACENSKQALQQKLLETAEKTGVQKYIARESVKAVTSDLTEFEITLSSATVRKLKTLQDLYSNKLKDGGVGKLVELLIDAEIERIEKMKLKSLKHSEKATNQTKGSEGLANKNVAKATAITLSAKGMARYNQIEDLRPLDGANAQLSQKQDYSLASQHSRYISVHDKRFVQARDQGQCQHPGCASTRYLHFDHVIPLSRGGKTVAQNLQLLCSAHNMAKGADAVH